MRAIHFSWIHEMHGFWGQGLTGSLFNVILSDTCCDAQWEAWFMRASGAPQNTIKYCCNGISTQFTARGAIYTERLALLNLFISLNCHIINQFLVEGLIHEGVRIAPKILWKYFAKKAGHGWICSKVFKCTVLRISWSILDQSQIQLSNSWIRADFASKAKNF